MGNSTSADTTPGDAGTMNVIDALTAFLSSPAMNECLPLRLKQGFSVDELAVTCRCCWRDLGGENSRGAVLYLADVDVVEAQGWGLCVDCRHLTGVHLRVRQLRDGTICLDTRHGTKWTRTTWREPLLLRIVRSAYKPILELVHSRR